MFSSYERIVEAVEKSFARPGMREVWVLKDTNEERYTWSYHPETWIEMGHWQPVAKFKNGQWEKIS
jgi:hypothetical protein